MGLEEILESMRGWEVEDAPGYADQIAQLFGDAKAGADASLAEVNSALEQKDAEIQRLQAENYKLMSAVGSAGAVSTDPTRPTPRPSLMGRTRPSRILPSLSKVVMSNARTVSNR